jgi:hypothetical protein
MRAMRLVPGLVLAFALLAGCKPDPYRPDAAPPYWKPKPGEYADWDIQLEATSANLMAPRAMYTIDLWDAVPAARTLDYGGGQTVQVPAGKDAGAIAELRSRATPAIVVCQVGTGAIRLTDPDAPRFPGYEANPPDRPKPRANGSVIGWSPLNGDPNVRFIDIHEASRSIVAPLIGKRLELAKMIGCDAIAAELHDQLSYQPTGHGFDDLDPETDYPSWSSELAARAHPIGLSIGLRSSTPQGIDGVTTQFDWLMMDRCAEYGNCSTARAFLNARKAVFAIEYLLDDVGEENNKADLCAQLAAAMISDGIIKDASMFSAPPERCMTQP